MPNYNTKATSRESEGIDTGSKVLDSQSIKSSELWIAAEL